ncbi:hypothetical protein J31TS4_00280 [Paenibacillus sp. J31TS4]|uniref:stage VI sporulation protein F n=1 Tax=Paenibacillus sp. J31TS4 TaxID=2807195 RepID=UPI001B121257|nr:stage VI sporulation protein F [Paenibacillus sp. J31TS4]GIP36748.1 hypothetical protein J31TS4_00280 [Paenibacillus sp. J31TS4]
MSYQQFGIPRELVERIKVKLKNPIAKDKVKRILDGVTKYDLQDKAKVSTLLAKVAKALNEPLSPSQSSNIVQFVLAQKIDPSNTFHLLKLWGMFR